MNTEELRKRVLKIQARAEKATKGPWAHKRCSACGEEMTHLEIADDGRTRVTNADFIVHARTDVPFLCAELLKVLKMKP